MKGYLLTYGNAYVSNTETTTKQHDDITSVVLDFLESEQENYEDENGMLPDDWYTSIFEEEKVVE